MGMPHSSERGSFTLMITIIHKFPSDCDCEPVHHHEARAKELWKQVEQSSLGAEGISVRDFVAEMSCLTGDNPEVVNGEPWAWPYSISKCASVKPSKSKKDSTRIHKISASG